MSVSWVFNTKSTQTIKEPFCFGTSKTCVFETSIMKEIEDLIKEIANYNKYVFIHKITTHLTSDNYNYRK